jgi:GAF domain-containing protein
VASALDVSGTARAAGQQTRSRAVRYGVALAAMGFGLAAATAFESFTESEFYPPLIGAAALAVWFGGLGPGLVAVSAGWGYELVAEVEFQSGLGHAEARWLAGLSVALAVVWVTAAMRSGTARASARADEATRASRETERLQELASRLAAAATPSDVARALVEEGSEVLAARGGALALVVGSEIEIVDPAALEGHARGPASRLSLEAATVLTEAARTDEIAWARSRGELTERYPDMGDLGRTDGGAIAVPVRVGGKVVGAIVFEYEEGVRIEEDKLALARVAADLGGQALERARLFEEERALREGLDRALRVAPRAGGGSPEEVAAEICREARRTFGSDVALMLSILDDERFAVDWREPPSALAAPGLRLRIEELPDLRSAMERGTVMWVPDMLSSLRGEALEIARTLGTISALRIPIAVAGRTDRVLALQWEVRIGDPTAASLALARRFADQAGLALEAAERRAAEELAERRAGEARTLLETTTALAAAVSPAEVVDVVLAHGALALGADAGVVALCEDGELVVLGAAGAPPEDLVRRVPLSESTPLSDAVRRNEVVVVESADDRRRRYPLLDRLRSPISHLASISVPLTARGVAIGGMAFGFVRPRRIDEAQRQLVAAIARQASAALERARLHEAERAARERAERSAARLAQLHALGIALGRARTEREVGEAVGRHITDVLGARSATVYALDEVQGVLRNVATTGALANLAPHDADIPLSSELPPVAAVRSGEALSTAAERAPTAEVADWAGDSVAAWGAAPMLVEGRTVGALAVSFDDATLLDDDAQRFVETVARYAGPPLDRVRLLEEERVARRSAEQAAWRTDRLQAATEALAATTTTSEVAATALRQMIQAVGTDAGVLYVRAPGAEHVEIAATAGVSREAASELSRVELSELSPVADVVATGAPVELPSSEEVAQRYAAFGARVRPAFPNGLAGIPLALGRRTMGAFLISIDGRELSADDVDLLVTLGGQSAQALDRARLLEAEKAAASRLQRLQRITAALSGAVTAEEVGRATLDAAAALGAHVGAVVVRSSADEVDVLAALGSSGPASGLPIEASLVEVFRTGRPVWALESLTGQEDTIARDRIGASPAWVALPLTGSDRVIGALVLGFERVRSLGDEDRALLQAVATQCALALERSRLYEDERDTREQIERLQHLTAQLSTSLTPAEVANAVLSAGSAALASDTAALVALGEDGTTLELLAAEAVPNAWIEAWEGAQLDESAPITDAMRSHEPVYVETREAILDRYPQQAHVLDFTGEHAWAVAPLAIGGRAVAALSFGWFQPQSFSPERRQLIETLSRQCAQALDRTRKHESERQIAETLQRSMLPDRLPDVDGVSLAARYVPGTAGMEVGGDWFDVLPLESGRLGLAVGDVVGKGVRAASTMGQLRNALRAFALEQLRPATAVARLNALVDTFADVPFATLVYLTLDPVRRVCRYTTAGHLPPLVLHPEGTVERLGEGRSLPLGVGPDVEFSQATAELEPGATIILYTDGLVERPGSSLEDGLQRLEQSLSGGGTAALDPGPLADRVLATLLAEGGPRDDVALLVVTLAPTRDDLVLQSSGSKAASASAQAGSGESRSSDDVP